MIKGILNFVPNYKDLTYVGFQQGNTQMFSALALNQGGLQDKINYFIALAPVVRIDHATDSFIVALKKFPENINETLEKMNLNFLFGPNWRDGSSKICSMLPYRFCNGPQELIDTRMRWPANSKGEFKKVSQTDQVNENGATRRQLVHYG